MTRLLLALSLPALAVPGFARSEPAAAAAHRPTRPMAGPPTYTRDVAPIVLGRCARCHRAGEAAPMALTSYDEVRPWARALKAAVVGRAMPPWFADARTSTRPFRNDPRLSDADIRTIAAWVDAGAPRGAGEEPAPPPLVAGWSVAALGEPDVVIEMPVAFDVPPDGAVPIQTFYAPSPFTETVFVEALELRPGSRAAVHHAIASAVRLPRGTRLVDGRPVAAGAPPDERSDEGSGVGGYKLIDYAPGRGPERHRPGTAKRIDPGMYFQFNMHYQATGRAESDRSRLGLWIARGPVSRLVESRGVNALLYVAGRAIVRTHLVDGREVSVRGRLPNIPPHADHWQVVGVLPVTEEITIQALAPHMHLRGSDVRYVLTWPDGRDEVLLDVPTYRFHWQLRYELAEPLAVPAGSRLAAIAHYDNSAKNPFNPAPDLEVMWGEQSWDEMFIPWVEYTTGRSGT